MENTTIPRIARIILIYDVMGLWHDVPNQLSARSQLTMKKTRQSLDATVLQAQYLCPTGEESQHTSAISLSDGGQVERSQGEGC